jgi:hypothetical protein
MRLFRLSRSALLATLLLVGCGGGESGGSGGAGPGACSFTLSGGATGEASCTALAIYDDAEGTTTISLSSDPSAATSVFIALTVSGKPSAATYTLASATDGHVSVYGAAGKWLASKTTSGAEVSLKITSATGVAGDVYDIHGTVSAKVPPTGATAASQTVSGTF